MAEKRWVEPIPNDKAACLMLAAELGISAVLADLLFIRNVRDFEQAKAFFRPSLDQLHDPFLMKDMDMAIARIQLAMERSEKILVYGDYDVDGTTAVSLVYSFLRKYHTELDFYIPSRYKEGYGISYTGIDWASEGGFGLIIALDCGIKSADHIQYAKEKGIDFIIADHHIPGEQLPLAVAVLDPKRADSGYPFDELSGCGIGYKLIHALSLKTPALDWNAEEYLDLVAVSIASDMVPVRGENRVMAYYGLKKLNSNPCTGLKAMVLRAGFKDVITFNEVLFHIGPRINAAGRMDDARHVVHLLTCEDLETAGDHGLFINEKNDERKSFDSQITEQAITMLTEIPGWEEKRSTVLFCADWHKGVIGIVASRVIEKHYRPTIILTESNGVATGSARSVSGFNIYEAICECSDLLDQFGGHKYAAGLSLPLSKLDSFISRFESVVAARIEESSRIPEILIDAELNFSSIDGKFFRILSQFAPFGPDNLQPVFMTRDLQLTEAPFRMKEKHLKLCVQDEQGFQFKAIAFNLGHLLEDLKIAGRFDICYQIEKNTWNNKTELQLNIKDIKLHLI